jgi:hypothetical protein
VDYYNDGPMIEKPKNYSQKEIAQELLRGAVDMHVHSAPSVFPRRADDKKVAFEAAEAGMVAVVLKSHEGDTAARANLLGADPSLAKAFGGVVLNNPVGGINPAAVEVSLKLEGRFVWLPTISAHHHMTYYNKAGRTFLGSSFKHCGGNGIRVIKENGQLVPAMSDIFDLVSESGAVLCTGHISPEEVLAVADGFLHCQHGGHFVYTHPDLSINRASLDVQLEVARKGGYIEKCILALHKEWGNVSIEKFIHGIKIIGPEYCFLSTDAGGPDRPSSPETLRDFIAQALDAGLTEKEVRKLIIAVPYKLLGV